jgi:hypothetical protein
MIGVRVGVGHQFAGGFDSSASAYFAATGITGTTEQQAVNTLVTSLKSAGLWSKMKAVYPFVTDNRNLFGYTENFGNGAWSKNQASVTDNTTTAPDSTTNADTITTTGASCLMYQTLPSLTNGQNYTATFYTKVGTNNFSFLGMHGLADAYFDLVNLTYSFSGTGAVSASITDAGNGWRRLKATWTWGAGTTYRVYWGMASSLSSQSGLTIGATQYLWGAQLELGSNATTYQPIATTQQSYISNQFKYNLVNPVDSDAAFRGVFNGGWTFSNQGALPNGVNGYMNTSLTPSVALAQNSASMGIYSRTNVAAQYSDYGVYDGVGFLQRTRRLTDTGGGYANATDQYTTNTSSLGFYCLSRISSSNFSFYKNGVGTSFTSTSSGIPALNSWLGACNFFGTMLEPTGRQIAFHYISDGLTDTEATALYNAVQTFNQTLQRQV